VSSVDDLINGSDLLAPAELPKGIQLWPYVINEVLSLNAFELSK
jgi:hypothetical protein